MSDIDTLCFEIEHKLATFEMANSMKIVGITIERNDAGEIKSVKAVARGEYIREN